MKRPRLAILGFPSTALASVLLLSAPLAAQRSERAIGDEMAFARELAVRYQYIDLAEVVLGRLAKERLSEPQKEGLALVQSQIYTEGAKREGDPKKRLEVFGKAAESFRDFFDDHPNSELRSEAERAYLGLVNNYGRALELALEEAVGDEAGALRETLKTVLDDGIKRTSALKEAYERSDLTQSEKIEKWRVQLDRAQMLITQGNVSPDPEFLFSRAQGELENIAEEAGETSGPGLNALLALAKLYRARGKFGEARDYAQFVVTTAVPRDPTDAEEWKNVPFEAKAERFRLVELAMPDLIESLVALDKMDQACNWSLYFYNAWKREGFTISPQGTLALLSAARALLDAGGFVGGSMTQGNLRWFESEEEMQKGGFSGRDARSALDLALKTAQDVNSENKGNTLQIRAQKLISDVISRPGVIVPPDVLFEAALGEYNTKNYETAIDSLKGVARALDDRDEATRREYMPKVLFYLGQAHAQLARPIEAAMAFREAATTWSGDPEYQEKAAQGFYREIGAVRRASPGDKLIDEQFFTAERLVTESSTGSVDVIKWRQGERAYDQKDYDAARTSYQGIGVAADEHEKAIVKAALCLYKKNDKAGAKREFAAYLEQFVPDPKNAVTGARKLAARDESRAQATYYLGKMAYDEQAYDEVLKALTGYEQKFPAQIEYAPNALYMVVQAQLAKKDVAAAKATSARMQELYATSKFTGIAAFGLYQALKSEQEAAAQAGDSARSTALKQEMARYVHVANEVASEPDFSRLRIESTLWLELGQFVEAESALRKTIQASEGKPERAGDLEKFVLPDLGEALLGQKRVPEAFEVLDPLVPKDDTDTRKPSAVVVRDWCRAVTGWVEGEGSAGEGRDFVEVPGVGGDFKRVTEYLDKLIKAEASTNEAWSCPWYGLKFEQIYAFLQWSKADSAQRATAKRLVDDIASQLGDPDLGDVAKKCGDSVLRQRYLWLRNQLR